MAVQDLTDPDLYWFADEVSTPDPIHKDEYKRNYRHSRTPVVIDNGSWQCRVGWASDDAPLLTFRNAIARIRGKKGDTDYTIMGNDITNVEAVRSTLKNQFDKNVVVNFSVQEQLLDHSFFLLGLGDEKSVRHPVVMTEPVCNPTYCRSMMSELLFECYGVPKVAYGIDGLFSMYHTCHSRGRDVTDGLVISSGYQSTYILPVVKGRFEASHCKRINVGGWHSLCYLQRLLQLRYTSLQAMITPSRVQELLENHCYVATNYAEELRASSRDPHTIQLPFSPAAKGAMLDAIQREEKDLQRRQRAREHLMKLNQRKREERIAELEEQLERLIHMQQLAPVSDPDDYQVTLEEAGFSSMESLLQAIQTVQEGLEVERTRLQTALQRLHAGSEQTQSTTETVDQQWLQSLRMRKKELLEQKKLRHQQHQELNKRHSAAAQNRMRIISQLAEENSTKGSKKKKDDTFGMDDDDWNVYRTISKSTSESDTEKEDAELTEISKILNRHEPGSLQQKSGCGNSSDPASHYQLQLRVNRFRAPEVVFQPTMVGVDQCGLVDALELILHSYPPDIQQRLVNNMIVTGGNTLFPGVEERLWTELRAIRPFQSDFSVLSASDKLLGGWCGAAVWGRDEEGEGWITKQQYKENGADYLSEHVASNLVVLPATDT